MPRLPRIARPAGTGPWSTAALALALAAVAIAGVAAAARAPGVDSARGGFTLDEGVRRLRAAVVGDVRGGDLRGGTSGADDAPPTRALPWGARHALAAVRRRATGAAPVASGPGVPWWADTAHWGPGVVFWSERTRPPLVAEAGDTVVLPAPELPAALPAALRARGIHWSATGPVTLLGGGRAVLDAPGDAEVDAFTPAGRTRTAVTVRPVLRGRLYAADGDGGVAARVIVRRGAAVDTVWSDAAGHFRLTLPTGDGGADLTTPADVRIEPVAPGHAAVALHDVPAARLHTLGVVMLPARWTIVGGSHAGTTVPVRAAAARGYWQFTGVHARPVGWMGDGPRTVALAQDVDAADSATFWRAARTLGEAWGRSLYVPAPPGDSADVVVRTTPVLLADGLTTLGWDGNGLVGSAAVEFRVRRPGALQEQVVTHELLHALGFGHARAWPSALAPAGRAGAPAPTAADVAYGQLYEAMRRQIARAEDTYGAAYGWADATT